MSSSGLLEQTDLRRIVDIQLERFRRRLADRELTLWISDTAKDFLAEVGYDPTFGARPGERVHDLGGPRAASMSGCRQIVC